MNEQCALMAYLPTPNASGETKRWFTPCPNRGIDGRFTWNWSADEKRHPFQPMAEIIEQVHKHRDDWLQEMEEIRRFKPPQDRTLIVVEFPDGTKIPLEMFA